MKKFTQKLGKRITAMALVLLMLASSGGASVFAEVAASPAPTAAAETQATPVPEDTSATATEPTPTEEPAATEAPTPTEAPAPTETPAATEAPADAAGEPTAQPEESPLPEDDASAAVTEPTPAPTEAPTPTPTATATPAPSAEPEAAANTLPQNGAQTLSEDTAATEETRTAEDWVDFNEVVRGNVEFHIWDDQGHEISDGGMIADDQEFTIHIDYTIDNDKLYQIDENTTLYYDFPAAIAMEGMENGHTGEMHDNLYYGVPGTYELNYVNAEGTVMEPGTEGGHWRLTFHYTNDYLSSRGSLTGTFDFSCKIDERVTSEGETVDLDFTGDGVGITINLSETKITAVKTYTENVNTDGTVDFSVDLHVNKRAKNVQVTDTMGAAFEFQKPATFTLTGPNNYVKPFTFEELTGNTVTLDVGELAAGDYTLSYTANVVKRAGESTAEEKQNTVTVTLDGEGDTNTVEVGWTDGAKWLTKTGSIEGPDANGKYTITWTIDINESIPRMNMAGATLTDVMKTTTGAGVSYEYSLEDVQVTRFYADGTSAPYTSGTATKTDDGFKYKFGSDAGTDQYQVVYTVKVDGKALQDGAYRTDNNVTLVLADLHDDTANAYVEWQINHNTSVQFKGRKTVLGNMPNGTQFSFDLYESDKEFSQSSLKETKTVTIQNGEPAEVTFESITYTRQDIGQTFYYVIREKVPETPDSKVPGVEYDDADRHIRVVVTEDTDGDVIATVYSQKVGEAESQWDTTSDLFTFTNTYDSVTAELPIKKTVTGDGKKAGSFTFELYEEGNSEAVQPSVTINANTQEQDGDFTGTGSLQLPTYYAADTYTYTLKEKQENVLEGGSTTADGMTYDSTVYTITVSVKEENNASGEGTHLVIDNIKITSTDSTDSFAQEGYTPDNLPTLEFVNTYDRVSIDFSGNKTIVGDILAGKNYPIQFSIDSADKQGVIVPDIGSQKDADNDKYHDAVTLNFGADTAKTLSYKFSGITYHRPGTHYYIVKENAYQTNVFAPRNYGYFIQVDVTKNDTTGKLKADVVKIYDLDAEGKVIWNQQSSATKDKLDFTNVYQGSGVGIYANKYINNYLSSESKFEFEWKKYASDPLNDSDAQVKDQGTVYNDDSVLPGLISLPLEFTAADLNGKDTATYFYKLKEKVGSDPNVIYDETNWYVFTVTLTKEDDGTVSAAVTKIRNQDGKTITPSSEDSNNDGIPDNTGANFYNTVYTPDTISFTANKTLTVVDRENDAKPALKTFQFELYEVTLDQNGKISKEELLQTESANDAGDVSFAAIPYDYKDIPASGGKDYYYKIVEKEGGQPAVGTVEYDKTEYYVKVHVSVNDTEYKVVHSAPVAMKKSGDTLVEAEAGDTLPTNDFAFTNRYIYHEVSVNLDLSGTKSIDIATGGGTFDPDQFQNFVFILENENHEEIKRVTATANADGTGTFHFQQNDWQIFTQAGHYVFYVREANPSQDGVTSVRGITSYDKTEYKITYRIGVDQTDQEAVKKGTLKCLGVTVEKVTSPLHSLISLFQGNDTSLTTTGLDFTNDYDEKTIPPDVTIEKTHHEISYKEGTVDWELNVYVRNLKNGAPITSLIITDKIKPTNAQNTTVNLDTIQVVEVTKGTDGKEILTPVEFEKLPLEGEYAEMSLAIKLVGDIEKNPNPAEDGLDHLYRVTYTSTTQPEQGETLSGSSVVLNNTATEKWECNGNTGEASDQDTVNFGSLLSKEGTLTKDMELTKTDGSTETRMVIEWTIDLDLSNIGDLESSTKFVITDTMDPGLRYIGTADGYTIHSTLKDENGDEIAISEPTVQPGADGEGQMLSWELTDLQQKRYSLTYYTEVTGEALDENNGNAATEVSNDAILYQDGTPIGTTEDTVTVQTDLLSKDGHPLDPDGGSGDAAEAYQVTYVIKVNPNELDLLPDDGIAPYLEMQDTLPEGTSLLTEVQFFDGRTYVYNGSNNTELTGEEYRYEMGNDEDGNTVIRIYLPDETSVVLQYTLGILNPPEGEEADEPITLTNTAQLLGQYKTSVEQTTRFKYYESGSTVSGVAGRLTLQKRDDQNDPLTDAAFSLYVYDTQQNQFTPVESEQNVTSSTGNYELGRKTPLRPDELYYWVESTLPTGYAKENSNGVDITQPHYVMLLGQKSEEEAKQDLQELMGEDFDVESVRFYGRYGIDVVYNTPLSTSITLSAEKQLDGAAFTVADTFSFTLKEVDGDELQTKYNDKAGKVTFDAINYDFHDVEDAQNHTKTFTYTIQEEAVDSEETYIYDQSVYTVEVTVSLNQNGTPDDRSDDTLKAEITSIQKDGEAQNATDAIIFNNLTSKTSISGTKVWELPEGVQVPDNDDITLTLYRYTANTLTPVEVSADDYEVKWKKTTDTQWTWTIENLTRFTPAGNGQREEYIYFVTETLNANNGKDYTFLPPVYTAPNGTDSGENASAEPDNGSAEAVEPAVQTTPAEDERAYNGYTITNRAVSETSVDLIATKYYYGLRPDQEFTFELVNANAKGEEVTGTGDWDNQSPIVVETAEGLIPNDVTATATIDDATHSGAVEFPTITYKRPGTYYYLMREQTSGSGSNEYQLVNDPSTYLVKVDVTVEEETNKLVAATSYTWMFDNMQEDVDAEDVAFYNNEVMMLSMDGAFVEITGEKIWESDDTPLTVEDDQFRFYLYEVKSGYTKGEQYLADQTLKPLASASTEAAKNGGNATFTFYYSISDVPAAGTTLAVVEENAGKTIDGITYSNDVKTVTLRWNDDNTVDVDNSTITGANAFANTSAVSIQVTKKWEDEEGTNLTHDPVTVYLYANVNGEEKQVSKIELPEGNKWTHTWNDLPARDEDGNKIVYTVGEEPVEYYTTTITDITKEDSGVTQSYLITNTFNAEGTVSIDPKITKRVEGRDEGETMTAGEFTFQLADENGTVLSTATNDAEGNVLFKTIRYTEEDIRIHTYTITEVAGSDPHFDYDDSVIQLQVTVARDEANPTQLVTTPEYLNPATDEKQTEFVNTYYPIILAVQKTSKDGSNDPLPGAIYGLWMVSETGGEDVYLGNCVADENGYMYFREGIEIGPRYYFKEEFAPEGHTVDEYPSVTFRVEKTDSGYQLVYDADNRLAKNAPSPTAEDGLIDEDLQAIVLEFKDGAVGVQDEVTKLYVNKLDTNTREPVTGAVLQIIEKDTGTVVYQWTSGETTQGMERVLNVDTTYILREVTAPDGYDKAEDTEFIFDAYGNLTVLSGADAEWVGDTTINLYNTKRDVTITRQVTDEVVRQVRQVAHVVRTIPQTGDGAPIVLVASLSLCGVLLIVYLQERKRANRKDR